MSTLPSYRDGLLSRLRRRNIAGVIDILLAPLLGVLLLVRVLTDDLSSPDSRHSGSLNLSGSIAVGFILLGAGLLLRRRRGMPAVALAALWLGVWTAVAVHTNGASSETLREGVRELSALALVVIVLNADGSVTVPVAARLIQFAGCIPAMLAIYQLATDTGMEVAHNIRANGTFAHPNSAAMFFAIALTASLWRYMDHGRRKLDVLFVALFAAALVATFSIDGLISLGVMLIALGSLHPGSLGVRAVPCLIAGLIVVTFLATPLGAKRVSGESATSLTAAERGETTSTFDTRLYRWKTLVPRWEESPVFGQGLGTTTTTESTAANKLNFLLPHNEYLRYLVETGIFGLVLLLAGLALLVRSLSHRRRANDSVNPDAFNAPSLGLAVVLGCLVNSLADNTLLNSPTCYAAGLIIAAMLAHPSAQMQSGRPPTTRTA